MRFPMKKGKKWKSQSMCGKKYNLAGWNPEFEAGLV